MHPLHLTPAGRRRARAFAIPFSGRPGPANAITDVAGVNVGYTTLVAGEGALEVGRGPVRTGVTMILPRPEADLLVPCFAGVHSFNGNGDMTGTHMIEEAGELTLPIGITNTNAVGTVRDAIVAWAFERFGRALDDAWALPVAAETYDGTLNDIAGGHVRAEHAVEAIRTAAAGPVEEGSVGGGTGMVAFAFKAGSGTASRVVGDAGADYTVGVFVQANYGKRPNLMVRGRRLGATLEGPRAVTNAPLREKGSIIAVVATDAPLLPHQLKRLARRVPLGIAWTGGLGYHSSGDIFVAFSTARPEGDGALRTARFVPDARIDPFFDAVVEATEEAILNAMVANETMAGRDGNTIPGLPHAALEAEFGLAE